jgi:RNA polymerase sigma-70 factor (ECF subfamily)
VALRAEFEAHLWDAVRELPEKLKVVVILCAMEEQGVGEVARLLGLPEGTVKSRLHLARRTLAEKLRWLVSGTNRT